MASETTEPHHHDHPIFLPRRDALRLGSVGIGALILSSCSSIGRSSNPTIGSTAPSTTTITTEIQRLTTLEGFDEFADSVNVIASDTYWLIESTGLPSHNMMKGITSWQQQVPLPMNFSGANAWSLPRNPRLADTPISAKTSLYRGAIALAVNGVPIFNALNNRGDDAFLAGELDEWGGHCGRADDYHYHVAPLHLQQTVGVDKPIAYALDGFPIFGSQEPDGSSLQPLDEFNGHIGNDGTYHYHGTTSYPYINGGLRGEIESIIGDQVEPQAHTTPIRPAGEPLRGARITDFSRQSKNSFLLTYVIDGQVGSVAYNYSSSSVTFTFTATDGTQTRETYSR